MIDATKTFTVYPPMSLTVHIEDCRDGRHDVSLNVQVGDAPSKTFSLVQDKSADVADALGLSDAGEAVQGGRLYDATIMVDGQGYDFGYIALAFDSASVIAEELASRVRVIRSVLDRRVKTETATVTV